MSNFEKITASPEALAEFLASLSVATGPWDESFHKEFCNSCKRKNCDGKKCPHQNERGNPAWWLRLGEKQGEAAGVTIKIKAAFPIEWDREYYTIDKTVKERRAPCTCCDNTGKVTIKGIEYECPRCKGNWREREVTGTTTVYSVAKWTLKSVHATSQSGIVLTFEQKNSKDRYSKSLEVRAADFRDMVRRYYGDETKVYDDYKAAMAEVKRLNAAEREKQEAD